MTWETKDFDKLKRLSKVEQEYINARLVLQMLEEKLKNCNSDSELDPEESLNKRISMWKEHISTLESKSI
jgi:hypothetical protein